MNKWKKVKLGDVAVISSGNSAPQGDEFFTNGIFPFCRTSDVGAVHLSTDLTEIKDKLNDTGIKGLTLFKKGTILIPKSGASTFLNHRAILGLDSYVSSHLATIQTNENFLFNLWAYYFFVTIDAKMLSPDTNYPTLKLSTISNIEIPLPTMEEQRKIAQRLDAVSDLLAKQKQLLSEQDNLIQSTFYDMFGTPEINEKGFPAHKISEICELNPKKPKEIDDNTECSFVPMSAVSEDGELNLTQIKLYEDVKKGFTYFAEEDVLFAKITPCMENGKGTIAKGLKNKLGFGSTEFHVLRPLNDISNARWLFQITKFKKFRENAEKSMTGSAGQKRVPAGFFDNYFIPVPPLELQEKFAAIVEQIESEKSKIKSAIAETQTLFNALMSEYFEE